MDKEISGFLIPALGSSLATLHSVQHPSSDLACASLRLGHLLPQGEKERRDISASLISNGGDRPQ